MKKRRTKKMDQKLKEEVLYVLESRLSRYADAANEWFRTTAKSIKGTYTDKISGDLPLYFRSNSKKWQSIIPYVSPFCFLFTKDLGISNMLDDNMRVEDMLEELTAEGLTLKRLKVVAKSNTHLMGTSRQVIILYPEDEALAADKGPVHLTLSVQDAAALLENASIDRKIRSKISRQLQNEGLYENIFN